MAFLIRHCEKLALGLALVGLLVGCYYMLHCLKIARSDVRELQELANSVDTGRKVLDPIKRTPVKIDKLLDDPALVIRLGEGSGKGALVEPPHYIRCLNPKCMYLISYEMDDCPFCAAKQPPQDIIVGDQDDYDKDGIPDFFEGQFPFLKPKDPSDAAMDQDQDTFTNLEEYRATTKLDDPSSHPPLITLVRYLKTFQRPIPVVLKKVSTNGADDPARWDITCQISDRGKLRNKLLRVGDEVEGYTILSAKSKTGKRINPRTKKEEEGDISEIVIRKDEDSPKYTLVVDNKGYEDDYYAMFLFAYSRYDTRAAKKYVLKPGESLKLPHRATRSYETYTVESVTERKVMVKRQDKGVSPDTYEVKPFDRRKARELFLPRPQTRQGAGDMPGEGMGPGDGEGMMEMMPGQDGMAPGGRPGGRTSRRRRDAF